MLTTESWQRFTAESDRLGLTLRGAVPVAEVAEFLMAEPPPPEATHAVIALQAGGQFWEHLRTLRRVNPVLDTHPDPLDTMTERLAARFAVLLGDGFVDVRFPFRSPFDFVSLGEAMKVGRRSRLSILLHPEYGPWIAFRMLWFVKAPAGLLPAAPVLAPHPCDTCPGYCRDACPAHAFTGEPGREQLDYPASFAYRNLHPETCETACAARLACPVGAAYQYPRDFLEAAHRRAHAFAQQYLAVKRPPAVKPTEPVQATLFDSPPFRKI